VAKVHLRASNNMIICMSSIEHIHQDYNNYKMDAFFRYLREPNILEDFKNTFDISAKFKYP
jgi:hypothetical protein